jgi:hypothetical protein
MMTTLSIVARIEAKSGQVELVKNALIKLKYLFFMKIGSLVTCGKCT